MADRRSLLSPPIVAALACAAGWATWWALWPLGLLLYLPLLGWAAGRGRTPALIAWLPSPFIVIPLVSAIGAIVGWVDGSARLQTVALPTAEVRNLHPELRIPIAPSQWPSDGRAAFRQAPHNAMLRLFGALSGPIKGGYTGPYPQRSLAWQMLDGAPSAASRRYTWHGEVIAELAHPDADLRAAMTGQTLVIGHPSQLWLIDSATNAAFATYRRAPGGPLLAVWPDPAPPAAPATAAGLNASPAL